MTNETIFIELMKQKAELILEKCNKLQESTIIKRNLEENMKPKRINQIIELANLIKDHANALKEELE